MWKRGLEVVDRLTQHGLYMGRKVANGRRSNTNKRLDVLCVWFRCIQGDGVTGIHSTSGWNMTDWDVLLIGRYQQQLRGEVF